MTTLCQNNSVMETEEKLVPSFEGIDPPLLDPVMVEHFNSLHSSELALEVPGGVGPALTISPTTASLQGISLEDLIRMATQICEVDPSYSEQIISLLQGQSTLDHDKIAEQNEQQTPQKSPQMIATTQQLSETSPQILKTIQKSPITSSPQMIVQERQLPQEPQRVHIQEPPVISQQARLPFQEGRSPLRSESGTSESSLPDTNTILSTLNQSILLQEYSHSLALQLATSKLQAEHQVPTSSPDSNLFVMENKGSNFIPLKDFRRPGPKYTRKNFSPDQIEGLEAAFQEHRFVKKELRKQLASKLNLSERSISYWFQNKRARSKPPITMSSEAALKAAQQQADQQATVSAVLQQTLQQSCAT